MMTREPSNTSTTTPRSGVRPSSVSRELGRVFQQEDINFLLTNRIPRRFANRFMYWFGRIQNPLVRAISIRTWKLFASDLDLSEAKKDRFSSLHDCFIRELVDGARMPDPEPTIVCSPCDGIVGTFGKIEGTELIQAKGFPYTLEDLLVDEERVDRFRDGVFVTIRIKSSMYHRFHAPTDCHVSKVDYVSGDTWNVNPIALRRVEGLFTKNERAVVDLELEEPDQNLTLVPVAAILVGGIVMNCLDGPLDLAYRGPNRIPCDASFEKGEEMGYFQHGSTIIALASGGLELHEDLVEGSTIRVGQPLLRSPLPLHSLR